MTHYELLGLAPTASDRLIRAAYRDRVRELHPDKGGDEQQMSSVNEAFAVLIDPRRRASYDAELRNLAPARWDEEEVAWADEPFVDEWGAEQESGVPPGTAPPPPGPPSPASTRQPSTHPEPGWEWAPPTEGHASSVAAHFSWEGGHNPVTDAPPIPTSTTEAVSPSDLGQWPSLLGGGRLAWAARVALAVLALLSLGWGLVAAIVSFTGGHVGTGINNLLLLASLALLAWFCGNVRARGGPVTKRYIGYIALGAMAALLSLSSNAATVTVVSVWMLSFVVAAESLHRLATGRR